MKKTSSCITTGFVCIPLPLIGVILAGRDMRQYLEFPPLTKYVRHAGFSPTLFGILALIEIVLYVLFILAIFRKATPSSARQSKTGRSFPWWGWSGILLCGISWLFAWNRWDWFAAFQPHTFTPLWTGYIFAINGLVYKRIGTCPLIEAPVAYLLLFPLSIIFWWFFEYFNRFVQNWYYMGVAQFSKSEYICFASISFSTVLPAVFATRSLLLTFNPFKKLKRAIPLHLQHEKPVACLLLTSALTSLLLIGAFPDVLFPILWVSPLLILESLLILSNHHSLLTSLRQGDWRNIASSSMAALLCSFFWEMWNFYSLARWEYSIPFVDRFHIFAMPVLGYVGYLPFGLQCTRLADIATSALSHTRKDSFADDS